MPVWYIVKLKWFLKSTFLACLFLITALSWGAEQQNRQIVATAVGTTAGGALDPTQAIVTSAIAKKSEQENTDQSKTPSNSKISIPNDMADGQSIRALPTLNKPIIDQAHLLSVSEINTLSAQIKELHQQAKAQIAIVIVPTTGQESIFDFAMRIANQWRLGTKEQDNGIVVAIAVNDRRIQILTGYGLEGVLPDVTVRRIIRNQITPAFKNGDIAQGLGAGLSEIQRILALDPDIAQRAAHQLQQQHEQALLEKQSHQDLLTYTVVILLIGIFASTIFSSRLVSSVAGIIAVIAGLFTGVGLLVSLMLGIGVFLLLVTSFAQLLLQLLMSIRGSGSSSGGDHFNGEDGYSGGGGDFGGGGSSDSW